MSQFIQFPSCSAVAKYDTFADFPATASNGALALALDTDVLYAYNIDSMTWVEIGGGGGSGITDLTGDVVATGPGSAVATIQPDVIVNSMIASAAAIAYSKLATLTASHALQSSAAGKVEVSGVLAVELGYVSGVTSAIQTQLNAKQATGNYITALSGDVVATGPGSAAAAIQAGVVTNTMVNASAAIALTKLAATTVSRALVSDGSGFIVPATTTATEIGYVNGVTSAIQTQLNAKQGLLATVTSVSSTLNLTSADSGTVFLVSTAAARTVNLPAPAAGLRFIFKDSTGQANTNNISVVRNGSEQIEGIAATKILQTSWGSWTIVTDGTNWFIL